MDRKDDTELIMVPRCGMTGICGYPKALLRKQEEIAGWIETVKILEEKLNELIDNRTEREELPDDVMTIDSEEYERLKDIEWKYTGL